MVKLKIEKPPKLDCGQRGEILAFIELSNVDGQRKVMVFVEGTILKPKSWFSLYNHNSYIPIGNAVAIIKEWQQQGSDIVYCTSRKGKQKKLQLCSLNMAL